MSQLAVRPAFLTRGFLATLLKSSGIAGIVLLGLTSTGFPGTQGLCTLWQRLLFRLSVKRSLMFNARMAGSGPSLTSLPDISAVSSRVWRILGQNPGMFTLQGTNTYVVGTGSSRILIDTGEGKAEYSALVKQFCAEQQVTEISDVLLTHWHGDHTGGVGDLRSMFPAAKVWKMARPMNQDQFDTSGPYLDIKEGQEFRTEGCVLKAVYTPGHADDHMCFYLPEEQACFAGDNVLGSGTTVFEDLAEYTASLKRIKALNPCRLYPAHGPVVENGQERIDMYLKHRQEREQQILEALEAFPDKQASVWDLVTVVYKGMPYSTMLAAVKPVTQHLHKCEKEGNVRLVNKGWSRSKDQYALIGGRSGL